MTRIVLLLLLTCMATPAAASGSVVRVTTSAETRYGGKYQDQAYTATVASVDHAAAGGERNDVLVALASRELRISDAAGLTAGPGCTQRSPTAVVCDVRNGVKAFASALGDLDDRALVRDLSGTVDGGPGDDVLDVGRSSAAGGPGADLLIADARLDGGPGPDVLRAATAQTAVAWYGDRTGAVTVTPGTGADDGEAGEGDDVGEEIHAIVGGAGDDALALDDRRGGSLLGGAGDDALTGKSEQDRLSGQAGDDRIDGGPGDDELSGGPGRDTVLGGGGDDRLLALGFEDGAGLVGIGAPDTLLGGPGDDRLFGGPGGDTLVGGAGSDTLEGGGGDDAIRARDGEVDLVGCAATRSGRSGGARLDASDLVRGCEEIDRAGAGRARALLAGPHELDADFGVAVGCPQDVRPSCRVRLRLGRGSVTVGETRGTIASGRARQLALVIDQRRLRRVPSAPPPKGKARFCGTQALRLTLDTRDAQGERVRKSYPVRFGSTGLACDLGFLDSYETGW